MSQSLFDAARDRAVRVMARSSEPVGFDTIAGAIIPAAVIASAYIIAFLAIRGKYRSQYAPRTYSQIIPEKDHTPSTSASGAKWFQDYRRLDDKFVLRHHSLDAFLFLRFFRMLILIAAVGCALTWPILFPLNATGGGTGQQLDVLAFGNVTKAKHCWGHAIVAIIFLSFVMLLVNRERIFLINLQQAYITTKPNALRLSSRVVLFLSTPKGESVERLFGDNVKQSWQVHFMDDLKKLVDERSQKVYDLESAELTLAQNVVKQRQKNNRDGAANGSSLERGDASVDHPHNRPTHRSLPLVGEKLDSIDHILSTISELNKQITDIREKYDWNGERQASAIFVEFKSQLHAHQAYQQIHHHDPLALQPRFIGIPPSNIKWQNLSMNPAVRVSKSFTAIALIVAIIVFWAIPVGFVGTISNIKYLADNYTFLAWINKLPPSIIGLIQGFLPPFLLSMITSYVPFWFRDIAELSGEPTAQSAENMTQKWYFAFQFLQVFLVTTLSSGAATILKRVSEQPDKIPDLLANNLPKSSNFYLTYFTLQGLSTASSQLIKYSDLFEYLFFKRIAKTPRQKYDIETKMKGLFYGSNYPKFTNMAVIAIVYSCIAPLVLGFALVGFTLFYATYRYLLLYSNNAKLELKGACHRRALQQILTGVYVSELCLIGLFGARNATGPSALMTIFFILTIVHHVLVNKYLSPLEEYIPLDILQAAEAENSDTDDVEANNNNNDDADAEEPLLSSSESRDTRAASRNQKSGGITNSLPVYVLDPFKNFLETNNILPSIRVVKPYILPSSDSDLNLRDSTLTTVPNYTDTQIANAYQNPALTSKVPIVWLARDGAGVSQEFKRRNRERAGLETTDEAASLDEGGTLVWDESDLSKAPVFKVATRF
ncbi:hypothetical protein OHC33_006554 [Knufia fluminis]|uniref:DUF221-domain-containing protein n=1 Tax=Knufia fluminis TaxID=191047 RepID=A0AAN8EEV5_9EURO|nr:hypothetical protein OHC33_006554 [Knufia fluminis]